MNRLLATLVLSLLFLASSSLAQTVQWKYVVPPPSVSERPLLLNEAHADALGGAALIFYSMSDDGTTVTGYRLVWLTRTGAVRGMADFTAEEAPTLFRISAVAVVVILADATTVRKFVIKSRKMVSSDLVLRADEAVTEGALLPDPNGFFTTATDEVSQSLAIRRYRN